MVKFIILLSTAGSLVHDVVFSGATGTFRAACTFRNAQSVKRFWLQKDKIAAQQRDPMAQFCFPFCAMFGSHFRPRGSNGNTNSLNTSSSWQLLYKIVSCRAAVWASSGSRMRLPGSTWEGCPPGSDYWPRCGLPGYVARSHHPDLGHAQNMAEVSQFPLADRTRQIVHWCYSRVPIVLSSDHMQHITAAVSIHASDSWAVSIHASDSSVSVEHTANRYILSSTAAETSEAIRGIVYHAGYYHMLHRLCQLSAGTHGRLLSTPEFQRVANTHGATSQATKLHPLLVGKSAPGGSTGIGCKWSKRGVDRYRRDHPTPWQGHNCH